jgi:AAA domain-containing protein
VNQPRFQPKAVPAGVPLAPLADATTVILEGQQIAASGVSYVVHGMIPDYGMLGFLIGYAKTGKTTFSLRLAAAVAMGQRFLDQPTQARRVLYLAIEDPPEYTAYLTRDLDVTPNTLSMYREPLTFSTKTLLDISATIRTGQYGLVLIASWQSAIAGMVKDENDNAGMNAIIDRVRQTVRASGVPWIIDAHAGKGEDQDDDADPLRALRGASSAAGAIDFSLSLRYADGPFGYKRKLSGKGRFVSVAPIVFEAEPTSASYRVVSVGGQVSHETTLRLLVETGAFSPEPRSVDDMAERAGLTTPKGRVTSATRRRIRDALQRCDSVRRTTERRRGQTTDLYAQIGPIGD